MSLDPNPKTLQKTVRCGCAAGCSSAASASTDVPVTADHAQDGEASVFLISTMDCPNEENDIRRAVASINGIRSMNFQLSARTLAIDATPEASWIGL